MDTASRSSKSGSKHEPEENRIFFLKYVESHKKVLMVYRHLFLKTMPGSPQTIVRVLKDALDI